METRTVNNLVVDRCKQGSETVPCPRKRRSTEELEIPQTEQRVVVTKRDVCCAGWSGDSCDTPLVLYGCHQVKLKGVLGGTRTQLDFIKKALEDKNGLKAGRQLESLAKVRATEKLNKKCLEGLQTKTRGCLCFNTSLEQDLSSEYITHITELGILKEGVNRFGCGWERNKDKRMISVCCLFKKKS